MKSPLSDSELLILGLIAEMPRHGYELESVIKKRAMREWTQIGFSSIYYVLSKLEKKELIEADVPEMEKGRKLYKITTKGIQVLVAQTLTTLKSVHPTYPSLLLGMIHLSSLTQDQATQALKTRQDAIAVEQKRIQGIHFEQQPLPDYVDVIFEYSLGQLRAEAIWIKKTLTYLENKTWIY